MPEQEDALAAYRADMTHASEQQEQEWLFDCIRLHEGKYPALKLAFHCPNEGRHTAAYRAKQARQGVRAGIPDVVLPVPLRQCGEAGDRLCTGLAIELKVRPNKLSVAQARWLADLAGCGWLTRVCYGWQEAWALIEAYLEGRA